MSKQSKSEVEAMIAALQNQLDDNAVTFPVTRRDERGHEKPVGCMENTEALINHHNVQVRYNEMSKAVEITLPKVLHADKALNDGIVIVRDLARKENYQAAVAEENLSPISSKHAYHPARDWILSAKWDGQDHITQLLATVETQESDEYKRLLITKWLISAVALLCYDTDHQNETHKREGFKGVEGILIFQGKQGKGKTRWLESLVPPRMPWVKDAVTLDPHNKDSVLLAVSHWIVELGEIDATFRKADVAALKGFATQKSDKLRPSYARTFDTYARRTAFTGTVNDMTFLAERGESRRWWTLEVLNIDANHNVNIQQLWAQAYDMYQQCIPYWLTEEERETVYRNNGKFEQIDPLIEKLAKYVRNPLVSADELGGESEALGTAGVEHLGAAAIAELMLDKAPSKRDANDVSQYLLNKGFYRPLATKRFKVKIDHAAMQADRQKTNYLFTSTKT